MRMTSLRLALLAAVLTVAPLAAQHGGHGGHGGGGPTVTVPSRPAPPTLAFFLPQEIAGAVTLVMAPRWAEGRMTVGVYATAPTGDLPAVDLMQTVTLHVRGQVISPISATPLGGQRSRATIVFPVADLPQRFALEVRGGPDSEQRTLAWPAKPAAATGGWR